MLVIIFSTRFFFVPITYKLFSPCSLLITEIVINQFILHSNRVLMNKKSDSLDMCAWTGTLKLQCSKSSWCSLSWHCNGTSCSWKFLCLFILVTSGMHVITLVDISFNIIIYRGCFYVSIEIEWIAWHILELKA